MRSADAQTLEDRRIRDRTCLRLVTIDEPSDDGDHDDCAHGCSHHDHQSAATDAEAPTTAPSLRTRLQKCDTLFALLEKTQKEHNAKKAQKAHDLKLFRASIVSAMGLSRGHWYKCKCGFIYCIADCGGAAETSSCPKCKGQIGGSNHRLAEGNTTAPEMVSGSSAVDYRWVGPDGR